MSNCGDLLFRKCLCGIIEKVINVKVAYDQLSGCIGPVGRWFWPLCDQVFSKMQLIV